MTTRRTDVHAPSSPDFDPEAYEVYGVFDLFPEWPSPAEAAYRIKVVNELLSQGYRFGSHGFGQCGHCGAHIRYAALLARADVHEMIYVGEDCLDNRFSGLTKGEFQSLRKAAALNRQRQAKADRIAALVEQHPLLAWATYPEALHEDGSFVQDVASKIREYAEPSDRQVEAFEKALVRNTERRDERVAEQATLVAAGVHVPSGRVTFTGTVLTVRVQDGYYGPQVKCLVKSSEGWKAWGTLPAALVGRTEKGDTVTLTATIEPSKDDEMFGFFSRPKAA